MAGAMETASVQVAPGVAIGFLPLLTFAIAVAIIGGH